MKHFYIFKTCRKVLLGLTTYIPGSQHAKEGQEIYPFFHTDLPATTVLPPEGGGAGRRTYLGDLQDTEHGVTGRVFGVSPDTLLVRDFSFDGAVADTHLWVGGPGEKQQGKA